MSYLEQNLLSHKDISNLSDKFRDLAIPSALNFKNILSGGSNYKKLNIINNDELISDESFDNLLKNVNPNNSFLLKNKSKHKRTKSLRIKSKTTRKKIK